MSQIFFPPGLEDIVSGRAASQIVNEGGNIGKAYDNLLALRIGEQENARELFKSLAATNPNLAAFVMTNTNLAKDLSETPTTLRSKGEVPFGQRVRDAFAEAATVKLPSLFTPEQRRNAMNDAMKGVRIATEFSADPITGKPRVLFSPEEIQVLAEAQLTGDLTTAAQVLGEEKLSYYLNSPEGEINSVEAMILKVIRDAGGLINPDGTPYSEDQMVAFLTDLSAKLRGDPSQMLQLRMEAAQILNKQRQEDMARQRKLEEEGKPLSNEEVQQELIDVQALEAEAAAGRLLVDGLKKFLELQQAGTPMEASERLALSGLARTYSSPMGLQFPLGQWLMTNQINPQVVLLLEQELLSTQLLIDTKKARIKRGRDIGEAEAGATNPASAADTAAARKGGKDGGGEPPPSTPETEDPEALADEIIKSLEEALTAAEKGE